MPFMSGTICNCTSSKRAVAFRAAMLAFTFSIENGSPSFWTSNDFNLAAFTSGRPAISTVETFCPSYEGRIFSIWGGVLAGSLEGTPVCPNADTENENRTTHVIRFAQRHVLKRTTLTHHTRKW